MIQTLGSEARMCTQVCQPTAPWFETTGLYFLFPSRRERKVISRLKEKNVQRHGGRKKQVLILDGRSAELSALPGRETLGWNPGRREG